MAAKQQLFAQFLRMIARQQKAKKNLGPQVLHFHLHAANEVVEPRLDTPEAPAKPEINIGFRPTVS